MSKIGFWVNKMKKIILSIILQIMILDAKDFGFTWDDREIKEKKNISFIYKDNDNYAYLNNKLFDIYLEDGGLMKTRLIFMKKDIISILVGTLNNIPSPDIKCEEVYAFLYNLFFYKNYNDFLLKLDINDDTFFSYDGNVMCEKRVFLYKTRASLEEKLKTLKISNNLILNSLETFLKPDYAKKYDSKFTFKDSAFNLDVLKAILKDIKLKKKNLTTYNNIAYYLQKAGANEEAIYLLEKILEKFPKRTVAYYNLGDAYWGLGDKTKAIRAYQTYIEQMRVKGKSKKIPQIVKDRVLGK